MEFIDSHVHLLYPEHFSYEWCASVPALNHACRMDDYRAAAANSAVGRVRSLVYLEADVPAVQQEAETEFFSRMADRDRVAPAVDAVVASAWPESVHFPEQVARLAGNPRVRGVRRVLHTQPNGLSLMPRFAEHLRLLPSHGLTFDLCLRPHLIPVASELAGRCPETQFVLDHCGVPDIGGGGLDPWRESIRCLAERPNVTCKFSGLASLCDPRRPLTLQVRPYFEHCLECFGPGRIMWGSDWPLCNVTFDLAAWLQTSVALLSELSPSEQRAIAHGTAGRIYRLQ